MDERILDVDNNLSTYDQIQDVIKCEYVDISYARLENEAVPLVS